MVLTAEILATGDELCSGTVVDTNTPWVAEALEAAGLVITRHHCVGDDPVGIQEVLREMCSRAAVVVVTGGLGPTEDDRTVEAVAGAFGRDLKEDPEALGVVQRAFERLNLPLNPVNRKQALIPEGAGCLDNPLGTAPGFTLELDNCRLFVLPGVPQEMKRMVRQSVLPELEKLPGADLRGTVKRRLTLFGVTESGAGERLGDIEAAFPGLRIGYRIRFPFIEVSMSLKGPDEAHLQNRMDQAVCWAGERLGRRLVSSEGRGLQEVVGELLRARGASLALAESCTGGLVAHQITSVAGSSDFFRFSGVTYSNRTKVAVLGVPEDVIAEYGAVHEKTASLMAEGARRAAQADYGLSTTGIAGPSGGTPEKPVGTVCVGLSGPSRVDSRRYTFPFRERRENLALFAATALNRLRQQLLREH